MYLDNNIKSLNVYHESVLHISLSKMMVQVKYLSCIESFALKQHNINTLHSCWHYEGYEGYTVSPAAAHCAAPALPSLMINCTWYKLQYPTFLVLRVNHYILTTMMIIIMALMTLTHSMFLQNNYLCCNVWQFLHTLMIIYYIT